MRVEAGNTAIPVVEANPYMQPPSPTLPGQPCNSAQKNASSLVGVRVLLGPLYNADPTWRIGKVSGVRLVGSEGAGDMVEVVPLLDPESNAQKARRICDAFSATIPVSEAFQRAQALAPGALTGARVCKQFYDENAKGQRWFSGRAVEFHPGNEDGVEQSLYSIEYEDGDREDMDVHEILKHLAEPLARWHDEFIDAAQTGLLRGNPDVVNKAVPRNVSRSAKTSRESKQKRQRGRPSSKGVPRHPTTTRLHGNSAALASSGLFAPCGAGHDRGVQAWDRKNNTFRAVGLWIQDKEHGTLLASKRIDFRHLPLDYDWEMHLGPGRSKSRPVPQVPGYIGVEASDLNGGWSPKYDGTYCIVFWESSLATRMRVESVRCDTAEEAARLYDRFALAYYGEDTKDTNFPVDEGTKAQVGSPEDGASSRIITCAVKLLQLEQAIPYAALSPTIAPDLDWSDWERHVLEEYVLHAPRHASIGEIGRRLAWLLEQVNECCIAPSWLSAGRLQAFKKACREVESVGFNHEHYFDTQGCPACHKLGGTRPKHRHGMRSLLSLLNTALEFILSSNALDVLNVDEDAIEEEALEAAAAQEREDRLHAYWAKQKGSSSRPSSPTETKYGGSKLAGVKRMRNLENDGELRKRRVVSERNAEKRTAHVVDESPSTSSIVSLSDTTAWTDDDVPLALLRGKNRGRIGAPSSRLRKQRSLLDEREAGAPPRRRGAKQRANATKSNVDASAVAQPSTMALKDLKVIVLGAGLAGLKAAVDLVGMGAHVTVLEAQQRVGGRVHSATLRSTDGGQEATVDLGASFVCGTSKTTKRVNPLLELAVDDLGLSLMATTAATWTANNDSFSPPCVYFDDDGKPMSSDVAAANDAVFNAVLSGLLDRMDATVRSNLGLKKGFKVPTGATSETHCLSALPSNIEDESAASALAAVVDGLPSRPEGRTVEAITTCFADLNVAPLHNVSFLGSMTSGFEGSHALLHGGMAQVTDALAAGHVTSHGHVNPPCIRLGAEAERIELLQGGVGVRVCIRGHPEPFEAHAVVSTLPLGVLQAGKVEFEPALPPSKREALKWLAMGGEERIAMLFELPFWPENVVTLRPLRGKYYFVNLHALGIQHALCACVRPDAVQDIQRWTEKQIVDDVCSVLKTMFPKAFVAPVATAASRWATNPFALGSHSYVKVGGKKDHRRWLAAPVTGDEVWDDSVAMDHVGGRGAWRRSLRKDTRLYFAGEATHGDFAASAHGALQSGRREASRVAAWWRQFRSAVVPAAQSESE